MILAVDIGGTKTLVALCNYSGDIKKQHKFPTAAGYQQFKKDLLNSIKTVGGNYEIMVVAAPGRIDRKTGNVLTYGNLKWRNTPLVADLKKATGKKIIVENDANLAGLYAAHTVKPLPHKVLYLTISTGIGSGIITSGVLDPDFLDSEAGNMLIEHDDELMIWEKFASGKAIVNKYGKKASEINDSKVWQNIAKDFAIGIVDLCAVLDPDVILIGGGVGAHFKKFGKYLNQQVAKMLPQMLDMPKIIQAPNAETAVIRGCVILATQIKESAK